MGEPSLVHVMYTGLAPISSTPSWSPRSFVPFGLFPFRLLPFRLLQDTDGKTLAESIYREIE